MSEPIELLAALDLARAALREAAVAHVFIGSLPVLAWGRPRATTDLDLVAFCDAAAFERLTNALDRRGFRAGKAIGPADPSDALPDIAVFWAPGASPVRIDVFIAKMAFEQAVLETARDAEVLGSSLRLASPEASIVYKLIAHRAKDLADVESVLEASAAAGRPVDWAFIERWCAEWEISERLAPFATRFKRS